VKKDPENPFVSRGGLKMVAALEAFALDIAGFTCADLGCNVGGFTDCLLQRGAAKVFAVDTGYGALAWKLRSDPRVVVMERTNAMHCEVPPGLAIDLVVIDLAWTKQKHAIAAALRWKPRRIVTLIKPHYESGTQGVLDDAEAERVTARVLSEMPSLGVTVLGHVASPLRGGAGKGKAGNLESLALLGPIA
jgi:23S rRNA (cytidine1920-2'-O)/16S rRNA (cytidine1409-2'-O)-methyltransferase